LFRSLVIASLICSIFNGPVSAKPLTAKSWLLADDTGKIYDSQNIDEVRPIASITKLLTVMVVLDAKQPLDEVLVLSTKLRDKLPKKDQRTTRKDVIEMTLVSSDNRAALTLCENYPGGVSACVGAMNNKAKMLGMLKTSVVEPTGLDKEDLSTARDLMTLVREARYYPEIGLSKQYQTRLLVNNKWITYTNTNPITQKNKNIQLSKTGWTYPAGGCIVMLFDTPIGDRIVVVLGSKSPKTRIPEAEQIFGLYTEN